VPTKGPPPRRPAAAITPRFIWPSPNKADTLFWVEKDGNLPDNKGWAYGDAYWDAATYPDHKLIHVTPQDADGWSRWYYVNDRATEDAYNWEFSQANLGGQKFDSVLRTYLLPRASFVHGTPAPGAAMPNVPAGLFSGTFVLVDREERRTGDETFDSLYVIDRRNYVKKVSITSLGVDELNGKVLTRTETLYYATEVVTGGLSAASLFGAPTNAYWGLQATGNQVSGQQLSAHWYLVVDEQVVAGTYAGGVVTIDTYTTHENYSLPPVLNIVELMDWERRDGGVDIYPAYRMNPEGFSGPCAVSVVRKWSKAIHTGLSVDVLLPTGIRYAGPFFSLNIPECLHERAEVYQNIGSNDPIYKKNVRSNRFFTKTYKVQTGAAPTEQTTWPATLVIQDSQQPFRGGYLRVTKTLTTPQTPAPVGWTTGT